jgi:hypothetical protein
MNCSKTDSLFRQSNFIIILPIHTQDGNVFLRIMKAIPAEHFFIMYLPNKFKIAALRPPNGKNINKTKKFRAL